MGVYAERATEKVVVLRRRPDGMWEPGPDLATELTVANRFAGGKLSYSVRIASSGDNVVLTPGSGRRLRVFWVGLSTPDDGGVANVLAVVKCGAAQPYRWNLSSPGAFMHWEEFGGVANDPLVVNLSTARAVDVNVTYLEV